MTSLKAFLARNLFKLVTAWKLPTAILPYVNMEVIKYLGIASSGDSDGTPWVRLHNGLIFFGHPPRRSDVDLYRRHHGELPKALKEPCIRVALDIAQRYAMENGYFQNLPRSYYMTPGGLWLDMGAYIGFGTMRGAATVGKEGRVVAVEIDADNYRLMERNIRENGIKNVKIVNCAVGDRDGVIDYFDGGYQSNTIVGNLDKVERSRVANVPCKTIDTLFFDQFGLSPKLPTFISLEINGAEPLAIKGASRLLTESKALKMRIAAPYVIGGESARTAVMRALAPHTDLVVYDLPRTHIIVHKYSE